MKENEVNSEHCYLKLFNWEVLIVSVMNSLSHDDIQCLINSSSNYKNVIITFCSLSEMFTSVSLWYFPIFLHWGEQTHLWSFSCHRLGQWVRVQNFCHLCLFLIHFKLSYATRSFWCSLKCFLKGIIWCILPMKKLSSCDVLLHKFYEYTNIIEDNILLRTEFFVAGIKLLFFFLCVCVHVCGYSHTQLP